MDPLEKIVKKLIEDKSDEWLNAYTVMLLNSPHARTPDVERSRIIRMSLIQSELYKRKANKNG